jgi:anaerobic magnesium-protoporphyrin IX monomethyl ester cyclase
MFSRLKMPVAIRPKSKNMPKPNILFQEPLISSEITFGKFAKVAGNNTFPYGMACLAARLHENGYSVRYLDPAMEKISLSSYEQFLLAENFDIIGISSTTLQIESTIKTFEFIKKVSPRIITILGGVHGTIMPMETMSATKAIDYIVLGEGERPLLKLVECLAEHQVDSIESINGICFRNNNKIICNAPDARDYLPAQEIPIPLFDIFPLRRYIPQITYAKSFPSYSVIASRGCPYQCAFCNASSTLGKQVRYKPVQTLLKELHELKEQYGARGIMFLDSTFTVNKKWLMEFCIEYTKSKLGLPWACNSRVDTIDRDLLAHMKEAGCWSILFGVESSNQKSLDLIKKGTTVSQNSQALSISLKLGFYVYASYILCLPGETKEDVLATIKYARSIANHMSIFYLPVPYPKTLLWQLCKEMGGLREDARWQDYNCWDYSNPVYVNPLIGKETMLELYKHAYLTFYSQPLVWIRNIRGMIFQGYSPYRFWLGVKALAQFFS